MERRSRSPQKALSTNSLDSSTSSFYLSQPPPPKAKLVLDGADSAFLESACYVEKKGVGVVYDYRTHHRLNENLVASRRALKAAKEVEIAAAADLETKEPNQRAYIEWLESKKRSRGERAARQLQDSKSFFDLLHPPPRSTSKTRDWDSFFVRQDLISRQQGRPKPGTITNISASSF